VTLAADVFFVDGIAFLLTVLRNIKFITAKHVATCTAKSLSKQLDRVIQVYTRAGFSVHTILMDGKFEKVKIELALVVCNTTAAKEHVSEAERSIRTIKEHSQGIVGTLPFEFIPRRLKMEFIYFVVQQHTHHRNSLSAGNLTTKKTAECSLELIARCTMNLRPQIP
jgi:acetolactate synthase regulatory subunit